MMSFDSARPLIWSIAYRMTGSAADADDLVQETFARALERPPADQTADPKPWLVTVAMNMSRDVLRRRKRAAYTGPWLPAPVDDARLAELAADPSARLERTETLSYAYLLALETLTPKQRAVLILRDVLDYSVADTARALALSEPNVKTTHHRARRVLEDARAASPIDRKLADLPARAGAALVAFIQALRAGDGPALEKLLAEDVLTLSDGGGEFLAAVQPIRGRDAVMRFWLGLAKKGRGSARVEVRPMNGEPSLVLEFEEGLPRQAPRGVWRVELDSAGRIVRIFAVLATRKLAGVAPISP